jgi:hypothetical protein
MCGHNQPLAKPLETAVRQRQLRRVNEYGYEMTDLLKMAENWLIN